MRRVDLVTPLYLPEGLYDRLRNLRRRLRSSSSKNLIGDRDIEWSWIAAHMPKGPGKALDFGAGQTNLGLLAAFRGFDVTLLDLQPVPRPYSHPRLTVLHGDILDLQLPAAQFDLILNCSSVEHVGLAGRYGVSKTRVDGDLEAMRELRKAMKSTGMMLLTVPAGQDAVFSPLLRVYGKERLPKLLAGYAVEEEGYWVKNSENRWISCTRDVALASEASARGWNPFSLVYALGGFVLRKAVA